MVSKLKLQILFFLLLLPVALAQADREATTGILRGLLGDLPSSCSDITSSVCIYCLGYVKLLPLAFFFGLFYLIFRYGTRLLIKNHSMAEVPSIQIGIILISIALSFFTLQTGAVGGALSRIASFSDWVGGLIVIVGITLISFFGFRILNAMRLTPGIGNNPMAIISILALSLVLIGLFGGFTASLSGGLFPAFLPLFIAILSVVFLFSLSQGIARNAIGAILIFLFLVLLLVIRTDFLPQLFKESTFNLGICA